MNIVKGRDDEGLAIWPYYKAATRPTALRCWISGIIGLKQENGP
jgi:hypothetical protein